MCGRTAQTDAAVRAAVKTLNVPLSPEIAEPHTNESSPERTDQDDPDWFMRDNFNMSPGMDAVVFFLDSNNQIQMERKVWGLVTRGGTPSNPLPSGIGQHFSNLMFNARSDTLYQKPSFSRLANARQSCLIAFDGFYEWKTELGKKQPYFVYRKKDPKDSESGGLPFLLMPGLWTSVQTGRKNDPVLDTFTLITTEVCPSLKWLHTRMPLCIWDTSRAKEWLSSPSENTFKNIEAQASAMEQFAWHSVTPEMSSIKYRSQDAMKALPKLKTVDSFFKKQMNTKTGTEPPLPEKKRPAEATQSSVQPSKKAKKGSILHFFSPKPKK